MRLKIRSVSTISHEVRLLAQCFFANDVIIKKVYRVVTLPTILLYGDTGYGDTTNEDTRIRRCRDTEIRK